MFWYEWNCFFLYKIFKSIKISVANIIDQLTAYLSTMMPARIAWATLRNLGFSSPRRLMLLIDLVKVSANQSLTSLGTASGSTSLSSSSSSHKRLTKQKKSQPITFLFSKWVQTSDVGTVGCIKKPLPCHITNKMSIGNIVCCIKDIFT